MGCVAPAPASRARQLAHGYVSGTRRSRCLGWRTGLSEFVRSLGPRLERHLDRGQVLDRTSDGCRSGRQAITSEMDRSTPLRVEPRSGGLAPGRKDKVGEGVCACPSRGLRSSVGLDVLRRAVLVARCAHIRIRDRSITPLSGLGSARPGGTPRSRTSRCSEFSAR